MGSVTISWDAQYDQRVIEGIAYQHGYQDMIEDPENPGQMIPNPETKAQFAKRMAQRWVKECIKAWEATQAAEQARQDALEDAEQVEIT
jgi:nucleoid-associated protein YgaU